MTITFTLSDDQQGDLLAEMRTLFDYSAITLVQAINEINSGNYDPAKASGAASKELRGAFDVVMAERAKLGKLGNNGAGGSDALELDAARDEIGRRLACLRAARGGGGVSGGVE